MGRGLLGFGIEVLIPLLWVALEKPVLIKNTRENKMLNYYVFIDCDKVQSYVFASTRLREICKASLLLDWIERDEILKIAKSCNGEVIRVGGGIGLVEFKDVNEA